MEKIESMIVFLYFGLAFIFYIMIMLYMSIKHRVRILSREFEYSKNDIKDDLKEMKRDIWKMK